MKKLTGLLILLALPGVNAFGAPVLTLNKGDHICYLGNALADRMQQHGWLETLIYAKFPDHDLIFRNLAASGDEVATWHRSENFGSRDDWLTKTKADVIFAFYGFNESFKGKEGLDKFKENLDAFLKHTQATNYSGKGPPRLVLFSPIANEKLSDPNLPDPAANNANLQLYTAAMAEVAKANQVPFVDLFAVSQRLFAQAAKQGRSLTFNTFLLTEAGQRVFMESGLFPLTPKHKMQGAPGSKIELAVEFTGGMRSYFDAPVANVYDEDIAKKRSEALKERFRKDIEALWKPS